MKHISSAANPEFKHLQLLLEKSRERKKQRLFVAEGQREIALALAAGLHIETLYIDPEVISPEQLPGLIPGSAGIPCVTFESALFKKVAYRENTEGIIAVVRWAELELNSLTLPENPLVLILESIEKPGNLGAILRTADAAGIDAVIVCNPLADIYNPNTIRSSVGGVFTNRIAVATTEEAIDWCRQKGLRTFVTSLEAASWYHQADYSRGAGIVMGTEATGVSDAWLAAADERIKIPMSGSIDSMNVSVAAAIMMFEVVRQEASGAFNRSGYQLTVCGTPVSRLSGFSITFPVQATAAQPGSALINYPGPDGKSQLLYSRQNGAPTAS